MEDWLFFDYNKKSSTLLIFFFNAVIFSFLLIKKGYSEQRNDSKWLGFFISLCGLYICPFMLGYAGWYTIKAYREFLFFVPFQQLYLIGPVLYIYTRTLLNKEFKLQNTDYLHFLPAVLYMVYSLIIVITDKLLLDAFYFYADGRDKDLAFWYQMAGLISMLYYLWISLKYYQAYRNFALQEVSFADEIDYKWIRNFLIAFAIILILRVFFFVLNPEWGQFGSKYWYYLCFSILFLYIAIAGYSSTVRSISMADLKLETISEMPETDEHQKQESTEEERLDIDFWKEKILEQIEVQQIYTDPNLSLTELAKTIQTNRSILSSVINQGFGMNFNDFINSKRVEAVILKLEDGEHLKHTLLSIALDSGFNSKATFNRAFKKYSSMTPKQYIDQNGLK